MTNSPRVRSSNSTNSARRLSGPIGLVAAVTVAAVLAATLVPGDAASDEPARRVVSVIDREDIELSGAANLSELLSSRFRFNTFGLHGARFRTGTAVFLLNGRNTSGLDFSVLDLSVVERVEVLDEGPVPRSAYGIGSVINIVLRNDFEGLELSAGPACPARRA